jgi:hypothetical protein
VPSGKAHRPDFVTASDEELSRYLRDCWIWADYQGISDAEEELKRRGRSDVVEHYRKIAEG